MNNKQQTIVFKISDNMKNDIIDFYSDRFAEKKAPYSVFQVKDYDCTITLYESGKIMFQGLGADIEASSCSWHSGSDVSRTGDRGGGEGAADSVGGKRGLEAFDVRHV